MRKANHSRACPTVLVKAVISTIWFVLEKSMYSWLIASSSSILHINSLFVLIWFSLIYLVLLSSFLYAIPMPFL